MNKSLKISAWVIFSLTSACFIKDSLFSVANLCVKSSDHIAVPGKVPEKADHPHQTLGCPQW